MRNSSLLVLVLCCVACGPREPEAPASPPPGVIAQELEDDNGLTQNGLTLNGLAFNGLAFNGLAFNGLASNAFASWFQQGPLTTSLFMKYLVRCSVPAGQSRSYWDGVTSYTWAGSLGLAPAWTGGAPATTEEQQVVSACLAALTNKYGRTVALSVLGANGQDVLIPYTAAELSEYSVREGCFFGNLFDGEGLFVGNDQALLSPGQSSLRACALSSSTALTGSVCPPLVHIGSCQEHCTLDTTGTYYTRCTYNGITYRPMTTRLHPQDLFTCGDGVCQFPETCGGDSECERDCGPCP